MATFPSVYRCHRVVWDPTISTMVAHLFGALLNAGRPAGQFPAEDRWARSHKKEGEMRATQRFTKGQASPDPAADVRTSEVVGRLRIQ